jgi:HAD superfamily hydrolase (TIGR01490 family)
MTYARAHGRGGRVRLFSAALAPSYLLRKLGVLSDEKFQHQLMTLLTQVMAGLNMAEGQALFEWTFREYLWPTQRAEVVARLRAHQAQGAAVVLVSGMFAPCLALLGQHLNITHLIGTQLEVQAGHYTGRFLPPLITGDAKATHTRERFAAQGLEIDWEGSYAYADSITDRGLFSLVGHPVAVYADAKLHTLAQAQNWEIIGVPRT